jgi:dTDP-glucose 4,6-dehydratase
MKNILVTGGLGFIGFNFIQYILNNNCCKLVINVDKIDYCSNNNTIIDQRYKFIHSDISKSIYEIRNYLELYQIDTIFHFGAETHVDNSYKNPEIFIDTNIRGTYYMLEATRLYGKLELFFHISTDEVYGDHKLFCEEDALEPTNPYSATKAGAEMFVKAYYHSYKLPYKMIRMNNIYGAHQYIDKLIPKTIHTFKSGKKMTIHGTGEIYRNFLHVKDAIRGILLIYYKGTPNNIYNIGSKNKVKIIDLIKTIYSKINGNDTNFLDNIIFVKDRPHNDEAYDMEYNKITELGWIEMEDFNKKLDELVNIY